MRNTLAKHFNGITHVCELAREEQKAYYNFLSINKDFFGEILTRLTTTIRRKPNYRPSGIIFQLLNYPSILHIFEFYLHSTYLWYFTCIVHSYHIPECSINSSSRHSKLLPHVLG